MAKSAPNRLGPEVRARRKNTLIRVSIVWDQTAPLPQPNMTRTPFRRRLFPSGGDFCAGPLNDGQPPSNRAGEIRLGSIGIIERCEKHSMPCSHCFDLLDSLRSNEPSSLRE